MDKDYVTIKVSRNTYRKFFITDILYFKANGSYTTIKTFSNECTLSDCLKEFEYLLTRNNFLKINRSYIVNTDNCIEVKVGKKSTIRIINGEVLFPCKESAEVILDFFCKRRLN